MRYYIIGLIVFFIVSCSYLFEKPEILSIYPENNSTNISENVRISVMFSKDMNKVTVENNLSLTASNNNQSVEGVFKWENNKTLYFIPLKQLTYSETYILTINKNSEDKNGIDLEENFNINFIVGQKLNVFKLISSFPKNNSVITNLKQNLIFNFSYPVTINDFNKYFSIYPDLKFYITLISNNKSVKLIPNNNYIYGNIYKCNISEQMIDIYKRVIDKEYKIYLTVGTNFEKPELIKTYSSSVNIFSDSITSNVEKTDSFYFEFSKEIDLTSFNENLIFSDDVKGIISTISTNKKIIKFIPNEFLSSEKQYLITIRDKVKDISGNYISDELRINFFVNGSNSIRPVVTGIQDNTGTPLNQEDSVSLSGNSYTNFNIYFNHPINESSIYQNLSVKYIMGQGATGIYIKNIKYNQTNISIDFENIDIGNIYKLIIKGGEKTGLKDLSTNYLKEDFVFYFHT